jgi:hypothetical protein
MSLAGEALGKIDLLKPLAESIYPAELAAIDYNDPSVQIDALAKMAKQIGSSELNSETQDVFHTLKPPPDKKPNITPVYHKYTSFWNFSFTIQNYVMIICYFCDSI